MGLRKKIILLTAIPVIIGMGLLLFISTRNLRHAVTQGYTKRGTDIINFSESRIRTINELYNPLHLEVLIDEITKTYSDIYSISIYAPVEGKVVRIGGSDKKRIGEIAEPHDIEPLKNDRITSYESRKIAEDIKVMEVLGPLHINGKPAASLGVYIPLTERDRLIIGHTARTHTIGAIALLAIIIFLNIFLNKFLISPIRDLQTASKSIARGDFNINLPIKGRDEVAGLAKTFMAMAASIRLKTVELTGAHFETILCLAQAIEAKDLYTKGHSERTANYAVQMAERLGLSEKEKEAIKYAAILHDIGKIGIKGSILNKPGKLTPEEYEEIRPIILYHHERWNGKGYPVGLAGKAIPIGARIISLLDAFDAMTSDRPYRKAMPLEDVIAEIKRCSGSQFDPRVVEVFLEIIQKEKV